MRIAASLPGRLALLALLAGAWGCYDTAPPRALPPLPPSSSDSGPISQPFDQRLVEPRFEKALGEYWRDLRTLRWDSTDVELRRALRLLAIAAERIPYTAGIDVPGAAAEVRGGRSGRGGTAVGALAAGDGSNLAALKRPLQNMAGSFVALAQGPYRNGVGVLQAAYGFDSAIRALFAAQTQGADRRATLEALGRGEEFLFAVRGAVGRAEVGLGDSGPPPAEFGPE
ncbi:MAG: hypothetical protein WKG00_07880 [Polyangiaceae bacterium]